MLGKLLKHEWKAVWKVPTLMIGILMITAVTAGITFLLPIWDSEWIGLPLSAMMLVLLFYVAMIATSLGTLIYLAVRYYKSMYTDEGYLTHTLPVTARELLFSKIITMSAWNLIASIAVILSMGVFFGIVMLSLATKESSFAVEAAEMIAEMGELYTSPYMEGFGAFCGSTVLMTLVGSVGSTMMIVGAIDLGQMVRKHRILGAIGAYYGIYSVLQVVMVIVMIPFMIRMAFEVEEVVEDMAIFSVYTPIFLIMSVIYVIVSVGLYFMSEYLVRRKLELE